VRFLRFHGHGSSYRHAMDKGVGVSEGGRQTVFLIRRCSYFKGFLGTSFRGKGCSPRESAPRSHWHCGKSRILSHGSTQSNAMEMGVVANDRLQQTADTVKRLNRFTVIWWR